MSEIKLSVVCLAYNHVRFIKQALDGFVMQKTNFPFEVIIHDDASTDGTTDIIKEYEKKYPQIIKPIYQTENQWCKGKTLSKTFIYPKIKGQYVAFCEGDDFWTDENKLQRQVDFLDANPDFSICFHPAQIIWEDKSAPNSIFPSSKKRFHKTVLNIQDLLKRNFMQTNTVVYRWIFKNEKDYDKIPNLILPADWFLHLLHAQTGKIAFLPQVMSVYRRHQGGVWWKKTNPTAFYERNGLLLLNFYTQVEKTFKVDRQKEIKNEGGKTLTALLKYKKWEKLEKFSEKFPQLYETLTSFDVKKKNKKIKYLKMINQSLIVVIIVLLLLLCF